MSSFDITIILGNKKRKLPKPINNRPGYDMNYLTSYFSKYCSERPKNFFENEREYDTLSRIRFNETPQQWAIRVRVPLQELISEKKGSFYHRYCLFASFGKGKLVDFDYYRPRIHKTHMAICFDCMKLIKIDDVKPRKSFDYLYRRFIEIVEPKDLMQHHWDTECDKPKSRDGHARIIQRAWRRFQEKEPSNARLAWNSLPNDNTPDDKKFLGLTQHKIKNPQTREQFNQWRTKWIELYKNDPMMRSSIIIRQYEENYIPYNWIDHKKSQLHIRFQK